MIPTPFPGLDPIYGIAVPLYDLQVQVKADDEIFAAKFDYVSETNSTTRAIVISFSVLAVLFLILGIVALVFTKMTGTTRSNSRDELLENHSGDLDDQDWAHHSIINKDDKDRHWVSSRLSLIMTYTPPKSLTDQLHSFSTLVD